VKPRRGDWLADQAATIAPTGIASRRLPWDFINSVVEKPGRKGMMPSGMPNHPFDDKSTQGEENEQDVQWETPLASVVLESAPPDPLEALLAAHKAGDKAAFLKVYRQLGKQPPEQ
jgi:hypothetical protein